MVETLAGLFGGLKITSGPLVVGALEAPGAGVLVDPAIDAAQVKDLPGLELNGGALLNATHLDALAKPADDAVSPGGIKNKRKILGALAL